MIGQTRNEQLFENQIGRDGSHAGTSFARVLFHTISLPVAIVFKAAAGSIALGFRIFTATAAQFGPPRM